MTGRGAARDGDELYLEVSPSLLCSPPPPLVRCFFLPGG